MRKYLILIALLTVALSACRVESIVTLDIEADGSALVGAELGDGKARQHQRRKQRNRRHRAPALLQEQTHLLDPQPHAAEQRDLR